MVSDTTERFQNGNLLSKKTAESPKNIQIPKFYMNLKIHKENNPGRPDINSINCHTSEISRFVDHSETKGKDKSDFVKNINNLTVPEYSILVTMDVKSLYTSIPNYEGIAALKQISMLGLRFMDDIFMIWTKSGNKTQTLYEGSQ